jgi:hypothetical protein
LGEHRPGRDREHDHVHDRERLTLAEAAEVLGISKDGVRMRVRRGQLPSEKGEDNRVYVFVEGLDTVQDNVPPRKEVGELLLQRQAHLQHRPSRRACLIQERDYSPRATALEGSQPRQSLQGSPEGSPGGSRIDQGGTSGLLLN